MATKNPKNPTTLTAYRRGDVFAWLVATGRYVTLRHVNGPKRGQVTRIKREHFSRGWAKTTANAATARELHPAGGAIVA